MTSVFNGATQKRLFIHAMSGDVGIGKSNPTAKLDVNGTIKANGKPTAVGEEELRIVRGTFSGAVNAPHETFTNSPYNAGGGLVLRGAGYRLRSDGYARYTIQFFTPFTDIPSFTVTPILPEGQARQFVKIFSATASEVRIQFTNDGGPDASPTDFHFIAIGPR